MTPDKLHRVHAKQTTGKGGNSLDVGPFRVRLEGASSAGPLKRAIAERLAICWNVAEGFQTEDLKNGVLLDIHDAVDGVLAAAEASDLSAFPSLRRALHQLRLAQERVDMEIDRSDGRLHDCESCLSEGDAPAIDDEPEAEPADAPTVLVPLAATLRALKGSP